MFIEVAVASEADFLVTGNLKHFPETARAGVRVVSPREFLDVLLEGTGPAAPASGRPALTIPAWTAARLSAPRQGF